MSSSQTLVGTLSTGGHNGTDYTGDRDLFRFTFTTPGTITFLVTWPGNADVDALIHDPAGAVVAQSSDSSPISLTQVVGPGTWVLGLFSRDVAVGWTVVWTFTPGGSVAPACVSPLSAAPADGCAIALSEPANGAVVTFPQAFSWQSNGGCDAPYHLVLYGDPPSVDNAVYWDPPSGTQVVDALSGVTTNTGIYHWQVASFAWNAWSDARTFTVQGVGPACTP